ncbi:hypothetical protein PCANC_14914 [Puccinia coronata f. sp. avenae]|uniref:Uncharacterized protein n=1 Tax=Puccinia coronata f. sp. avenae TaxID=200324 RepID=A0A2N5UKG3_9BASI|nr:hypothetical protein PCANC_14914 [Puccinia coronata f. sp. avenae]
MTVCGLRPSGNHTRSIAVTDHKSPSGVASWGAAPQGHASVFFHLETKYCNTDPSSDFVSLALPQKATEAHKLARGIVPLFPNQRQIAQCSKLVPAQRGSTPSQNMGWYQPSECSPSWYQPSR